MPFLVIARDKPDHLQVRLDNRPAHVEHLKSLGDVLKLAGPTLDADGNPDGSLLIFNCATAEEVEDIIERDPYTQAGLFGQVAIAPWRQALPEA